MLKTITIFFSVLLFGNISFGQQSEIIKKYVEQYKDIAIAEMQRTGVPAAITLAQGIHESGAGNGKLALTANNHFGIKCKSNWAGESVKHTDDAKNECFRKYTSAEESYRDHSDFLKNSQRYAFLFQLAPADYAAWANGLKQAGYATNPKYAPALIKLIEDYQLQEYTLLVINKPSGGDVAARKDEIPGEIVITANHAVPKELKIRAAETVKPSVVYPEELFKINETKVVFVKKGTSFLSVAKQYDIDLKKLFEVNEIQEAEESDKDQLIYVQRKRKTGANEFHIVQPGETLHSIAQAEAIRLESLLELNWLQKGMQPAPGEKLYLKEKSATVPRLMLKENYSVLPQAINKTAH